MSETVRQRVLWLVWSVVLLASLAAVVLLNRRAAGVRLVRWQARAYRSHAIDRYGFALEESARRLGVDFVHQGPTFDSRLDHIMPQVASMGAAVAVADFDRDGWPDFYVTNSGEGSRNRLYRNQGDGTFKDVADAMGVADVNRPGTGVSMGAVWGDYDNDGYEDLFVYKYGRPELFHNDRGRGFTPVGEKAGLPRWVNANSAVWLDYDRDGRLDLFLPATGRRTSISGTSRPRKIMPESFEYAENGGRKYLFHNRGDGTVRGSGREARPSSRRWTLAAAAADLAGTGYPDLFLANDYGVSQLYLNQHGKGFVEAGRETGVGPDAQERDERRLRRHLQRRPPVDLQDQHLRAGRAGAGERPLGAQEGNQRESSSTRTSPSSLGVDLGGWSWGAQFGDLNNDGTLDLYLTNGYVSAGERTSYWYDFAVIARGHSAIIADAKNWPAMRGRSLSGYQRKRVWLNDGSGRFTDVAQVVGATDTYDGRAVALADLSNRGVARRHRRQPARAAAGLQEPRAAGTPLDRSSSSRDARAIAAPSARASSSGGTARRRCRR